VERSGIEEPRTRILAAVAESKEGRPYTITAGDWDRVVVDPLFTILQVRDAAIWRELAAQSDRGIGAAWTRLAVLIAVLITGLVLLAGAAFVCQRKVLAALERIAGLMGDVAKGDFSVTIPDTARKDEVGQIATRAGGVQGQRAAHAGARRAAEVGAGEGRRSARQRSTA
jgi:HAMP domain-containing protein